jgi:hypothetical protein
MRWDEMRDEMKDERRDEMRDEMRDVKFNILHTIGRSRQPTSSSVPLNKTIIKKIIA